MKNFNGRLRKLENGLNGNHKEEDSDIDARIVHFLENTDPAPFEAMVYDGFEDVETWLSTGLLLPDPHRVNDLIRWPYHNNELGHEIASYRGYFVAQYFVILTAVFVRTGIPDPDPGGYDKLYEHLQAGNDLISSYWLHNSVAWLKQSVTGNVTSKDYRTIALPFTPECKPDCYHKPFVTFTLADRDEWNANPGESNRMIFERYRQEAARKHPEFWKGYLDCE